MESWMTRALWLVALTSAIACGGGGDDDDEDEGPAIPVMKTGTVVALTENNLLITFDPGTPGVLLSNRPRQDLGTGEFMLAIDYRPAPGELFGFSNLGRLYRVDASSGDTTLVGTGAISPPLVGTEVGFDF